MGNRRCVGETKRDDRLSERDTERDRDIELDRVSATQRENEIG